LSAISPKGHTIKITMGMRCGLIENFWVQ